MWRPSSTPTSTPRWSNVRWPQAPSGRCGWTSRGPTTRALSGADHLRPAGGRRRLHRAVDRAARRAAQPGPAHRPDRGRPHRLGGLGAQRRVRRRQPHPRRRERKVALAQRDRPTRGDGPGEPRRHAGRDRRARPRRRMAAHRHAGGGHRAAPGGVAARRPPTRGRASSSTATQVRDEVAFADLSGRAVQRRHLRDRPPGQAGARTGPRLPGGRCARSTSTPTRRPLDSGGAALRVDTGGAVITAAQVVLATNVFPSLLRRNRLHTVPVYDYVLATEPLTDAQLRPHRLAEPAGNRRLRQPVSLLPPDRGQPDRLGRIRRHLPLRPHGRRRPTRTGRTPTAGWPRTSSSPSRNSTTSGSATAGPAPSTPTPGSARTGDWPATAGSPTSTASPASVSARPGLPPTCASTCSSGRPTPRTELEMVREQAAAVSSRTVGQHRNPGHPVVARPCRSHRGTAQRPAAHPGRARPRLRLLARPTELNAPHATGCSPSVLLARAEPPTGQPRSVGSATPTRKGLRSWETDFKRTRSWRSVSRLTSNNGAYTLTLQDDGNLVLYAVTRRSGRPSTNGQNVVRAEVQKDGNFVLYTPDKPVWHSRHQGRQGRQADPAGRPQPGALRLRRPGLVVEHPDRRGAADRPPPAAEPEVAPAAVRGVAPPRPPKRRAAEPPRHHHRHRRPHRAPTRWCPGHAVGHRRAVLRRRQQVPRRSPRPAASPTPT